ncbi:DUF3303 family protein [Actinomadura violacea]|uniref:DUF3303 domain-containing protein n=1 Tax=Actinomadura violacea TaxID=2819934 RepID=A0ABS3RRH7_9ACTN|nr:DUF3303 family protein [Actinomadura violacea]MBO2458918.1 hypothetical protein [Actinomadura violacea]
MRMMLRARMDTRMGNEALKNGTLPETMQALVDKLKPEAAYFTAVEGRRCATLVFDMQDSSQIPSIAEPLFKALGAEIEIVPAMNLDDLRKGLAAL